MLFLFRYISGYLIVRFSGEFCEEILNIAAANHIIFWNLAYNKGKITGCISVKDFKKLRTLKRKCKTKIKILKKCGLPFKTEKYKCRFGFITGAVIFILLLNYLSGYIWNIDVVGNSKVAKEEIIKTCEEMNVGLGTNKRKIKSSILSQKLALKIPEIAWASFNVEGSKLTVNVTETRLKENSDKNPNNIIAGADGVIEKIDISGGKPVVKIGDAVRCGDLIVSGTYESMNQTVFENVTGNVTAKTTRTFTLSENYKQTVLMPYGNTVKHTVIKAFNIKIPLFLGDVQGSFNSKTEKSILKITDCELPVFAITKTFVPLKEKTVVYSKEKLCKILEEKMEEQIKNCNISEYETESFEIDETEKGIRLKRTITAHENIAVFEDILIGDID